MQVSVFDAMKPQKIITKCSTKIDLHFFETMYFAQGKWTTLVLLECKHKDHIARKKEIEQLQINIKSLR